MNGFSEIKLTWDGKAFVIPPRGRLEAIAAIEEVLTLDELMRSEKKPPSFAKVAMAYGALLRHLGADASDDAVYASLFAGKGANMMQTVQTLLLMMVPPQSMMEGLAAGASGNARAADTSLSSNSIRPRSRKNGSRRQNFGH